MFPIIYTPTEGDAIAGYSGLFRRPEGCFLNIRDKDRIPHDLERWGETDDIDLIVVSDGEQVRHISIANACYPNFNLKDSWDW
jgi:malate dehydrogenase (oxaloacetate-decarboxylating)